MRGCERLCWTTERSVTNIAPMKEFHKIHTVFKRDESTKFKNLIEGDYSLPEFEYLKDNEWVFTEKVDGTNIRVMIDKGQPGWIGFGGKTDAAQIPAFLVEHLRATFDPLKEALTAQFPEGACLYGEGYGARIQKGGGNYSPDAKFVLFDIKVGEWWLQRDAVRNISDQFNLDMVPIIGTGTLGEMVEMARAGIVSRWGAFAAEGIVARPATELKTRSGYRVITKIKTKDFAK